MKFLHVSDIHLGLNQYQLEDRTADFGKAWAEVLFNYAIKNAVDFVLIAGDLFDKRTPPPRAFDQAYSGLLELQKAGIPAVAIEGNHDETQDIESQWSWLRSLKHAGLLKLLEPALPVKDENGDLFFDYQEWSDDERYCGYIDIAGARIFGSRWYRHSLNAMIPPIIKGIEKKSRPDLFNILMLHTDVEGHETHRGHIPALSQVNLPGMKAVTNYVALGHTHKRIEIDNWIFNPGSLETCKSDEYRQERGAYLVEVDAEKNVTAEFLRDYYQRPFASIVFNVDGLADGEAVTEGVLKTVAGEITAHHADSNAPAPIVEVMLRGHLGFPNSLIEFDSIRQQIKETTGALHVRLKNNTVPIEYAVAAGMSDDASREVRERRVIEDLIARDNRYGERKEAIAELVIGAKRMALSDDAPDKILDYILTKTG